MNIIGADNDRNPSQVVHGLKTPTQANQEAAILVLEKTLEAAKAGRIAAVAIAYVRDNRTSTSQAWSSCDCVPALIGAVATMQTNMIMSAVEIARNPSKT